MAKSTAEYEVHVQSRTEPPPRILYKYATAETAEAILTTGRLRFQSPLRYNDPFDAQWSPLWPLSTQEAQEYERQILTEALVDEACWPSDADPEMARGMKLERERLNQTPPEQRAKAIEDFVTAHCGLTFVTKRARSHQDDMIARLRILCLCESERSLLMWSHYADQHRGVVIGIHVPTLESAYTRPLERVKYTDQLPELLDWKAWIRASVFGLSDDGLPQPVRDWALTKHSGWSYESEWRYVWTEPPGTPGLFRDNEFPRAALAEVVCGAKTSSERAESLCRLAREYNPGVQLSKLRMHPSRFELVKSSE